MAGGVRLDFEPLEAPGVMDPTEAATWGRLVIDVEAADGRRSRLTRVWDRVSKVERGGVYDSLMPLAEWLARCWPHISGGRRLAPGPAAARRDRYAWDRTHRLRYAGQGAALPDLRMWASRDGYVSLRWTADAGGEDDRYQRVRFLEEGQVELATSAVRASVGEIMALVLDRLDAAARDEPRTRALSEVWRRALDPSAPGADLARLLARMGAVWSDLSAEERARLSRTLLGEGGVATDPLLEGILDLRAARPDPDLLRRALREIRDSVGSGEVEAVDLRELRKKLRAKAGSPPPTPWEEGWRQAHDLRELLDIPHDRPWHPDRPDWTPSDLSLEAVRPCGDESVVAWFDGRRAQRAVGSERRGFSDVRDTWPVLFGRDGGSGSLALSSGLAGPTSIANAFAAELVAPRRAVSEAVGGRKWIDLDDIHEIATELGAPFGCVRHQVENHHLARVEY